MRIEVTASASVGKLQVLECHKYNNDGVELGYKYINAKYLKEKVVIKKFPGFKKVEAFLNIEEGLKFYEETEHTRII